MTIRNRHIRRVLALSVALAVLTVAGCGDEPSSGSDETSPLSTQPVDGVPATGPDTPSSSSTEPADEAPGTSQAGSLSTAAVPASAPRSASSTPLASPPATTVAASTAPDPRPADDPCRLITPEEAAAALGKAVVVTPEKAEFDGGATGPGAGCGYRAANETGNSVIQVSVLGTGFPQDVWEQAQQAEGFQTVTGVGDVAFFDDDTTMEVYVEGTWLSIQMIGSERYDEVLAVLTDVGQNAVDRL